MPKHLSEVERGQIITLLAEGYSSREIAKKLKISQSSVMRAKQKHKKTGTYKHLCGNGRPSVLNESIINIIDSENKRNRKTSLRKLKEVVKQKGKTTISHVTIRKGLHQLGLQAYSPTKKPLLTKKHIVSRYNIGKQWLCMSEEEIKNIIWSDESKFNLFYSDGRVKIWRESGSSLQNGCFDPTVKHGGGSVMVWACFSYHGVGRLVFIDGIMDAAKYVNILANNLSPSASKMGISDYFFQQDNDPKHTSRLAKAFFANKKIKTLPWPSQSPDLNPIENLWAILKQRVSAIRPKNKLELKEAIENTWYSVSQETTKKLALSFGKRVLEVVRNGGKLTKY